MKYPRHRLSQKSRNQAIRSRLRKRLHYYAYPNKGGPAQAPRRSEQGASPVSVATSNATRQSHSVIIVSRAGDTAKDTPARGIRSRNLLALRRSSGIRRRSFLQQSEQCRCIFNQILTTSRRMWICATLTSS